MKLIFCLSIVACSNPFFTGCRSACEKLNPQLEVTLSTDPKIVLTDVATVEINTRLNGGPFKSRSVERNQIGLLGAEVSRFKINFDTPAVQEGDRLWIRIMFLDTSLQEIAAGEPAQNPIVLQMNACNFAAVTIGQDPQDGGMNGDTANRDGGAVNSDTSVDHLIPGKDHGVPDHARPEMGRADSNLTVPDQQGQDHSMSDIDLATPDTSQPDMGVPDSQPPIPDSGGGCDHPPVIENCSNGWCNIPAGCFTMGSPTTEAPCRGGDEQERSVSLTHNFEIQRHETTQAQFQGLMGYNPSWFSASGSGADCGADCPVENINWHEATAYCNALSADKCYDCAGTLENVTCTIKSEFEGAQISSCSGYRLPTESEWEYAYRAGTTTAFYNGPITNCHNQDPNAELISWYTNNANSTTHPVGLNDPSPRQPNAWGLYDMSGNVGEWCSDWHSAEPWSSGTVDPAGPTTGLNRMSRGGAYHYNPGWLRAALRDFHDPLNRLSRVGFRCVRSL